jgi:hypothetical protein
MGHFMTEPPHSLFPIHLHLCPQPVPYSVLYIFPLLYSSICSLSPQWSFIIPQLHILSSPKQPCSSQCLTDVWTTASLWFWQLVRFLLFQLSYIHLLVVKYLLQTLAEQLNASPIKLGRPIAHKFCFLEVQLPKNHCVSYIVLHVSPPYIRIDK